MSTPNSPAAKAPDLFAGLTLNASKDNGISNTSSNSNSNGNHTNNNNNNDDSGSRLHSETTPVVSNRGMSIPRSTVPPELSAPSLSEDATYDDPPPAAENEDTLLGALAHVPEDTIVVHANGDDDATPPASNNGGGGGGMFGWLSGSTAPPEPPKETAPVAPPKVAASSANGDSTTPAASTEGKAGENKTPNHEEEEETEDQSKPPRVLAPEEQNQLDSAFAHASPTAASSATTQPAAATEAAAAVPPPPANARLTLDPATPVPAARMARRLLRKFVQQTQAHVSVTYGGTQSRSLLSYVYTSGGASATAANDTAFGPYQALITALGEDETDVSGNGMVESSEGSQSSYTASDTPPPADPAVTAQAGYALAAFLDLCSVWGHASSARLEMKDRKGQALFGQLLCQAFVTAADLAAHGCLDGVRLRVASKPSSSSNSSSNSSTEDNEGGTTTDPAAANDDFHEAAPLLASSVFNSDLSQEAVELAAMKFLLGAGCRQHPASLLRGSYLLQSIRTLYHVYLTTESKANKVTARAALQQLVTSVFTKVVKTDVSSSSAMDAKTASDTPTSGKPAGDGFPSDNHRDAFLVLRSICKLSMRTLPGGEQSGGAAGLHSHVGLATSASHDTWDGEKMRSLSDRGPGSSHGPDAHREHAQLVYTSAIHPALESKLLALELIRYVLQNTDFSQGTFIQHAGPQFHAAIRNYLCVSLLKNCTSDNTRVVNLSLRIFVPVVRNFRTVLKSEIEAFVTNVFFVILDSKNSPAEHKSIVVHTFNEICSDPSTLAEIFLNYDCDLSAVDLFHRIVNTLSRLSRTGLHESMRHAGGGTTGGGGVTSLLLGGGPSEAQMEKFRNESRELRLDAMRALRQILASLHASIVEPLGDKAATDAAESAPSSPNGKQSLVEIYGSKKKRRAEESEAVLRFNQKPSAGIAYAAKCKHIDPEDPADVARYLLKNKDEFEKTQIGEYLGREAEYQGGFSIRVLHEYARLMDFQDLVFDEAIRFFLSGFRLPGEAQKIDRIMEKFAERFTEQNPTVFPTADAAFILSFSIIMLNTDLHNPAIKEERRMTKEGFIRNNRGICDGQDLPEDLLNSIFDRIKKNPISLKEDEELRERVGDGKRSTVVTALNPASFFASHYNDMDRARETNFQKERDHIVRTTESLLKRRRSHTSEANSKQSPANRNRSLKPGRSTRFVLSGDSGLRDEYVSPMFDVTWGPALAAFSTAVESANGTAGALISIASDEELELAAENAAETIEVCLTGFRFAIGTAGLCGNSIARDAYMIALSRFSQLGTGVLLEPRHIRCVQTMLSLAREDGELLGGSWEHVFKALSEINRFHQLFHLMARNDRAAAIAAERRREKLRAKELRREAREQRRMAAEDGESIGDAADYYESESEDEDSLAESGLFSDQEDFELEENMDAKAIDEANAREVYDAVSEGTIEAIYERSSSLSAPAVKEFIVQLCFVSRAEISVGTNDQTDLTQVTYRQKHALLNNTSNANSPGDQFHHTQPNIYNLQKLVEVTHYNMSSRPRLIFSQLWLTVADHLTDTALHSNPAVAMYAVDSFRQLSIQYLKRDESEVFEFQRRFLKPLETVMARSLQTSTKELLLNCIGRLMHVFDANSELDSSSVQKGGLRSGWVPILIILGLGGQDSDESISQMSFKMLSGEIQQCLNDERHPDVLLSEHFVETVDALLSIAGGSHSDISLGAIDQLKKLTDALASGTVSPVPVRRKTSPTEAPSEECTQQRLGFWWPILLGLSRSVGDTRLQVRTKSLAALFGIINEHFVDSSDDTPASFETLQLIFRGVLNSILEFGESSTDMEPTPGLPEDFERILTPKPESDGEPADNENSWLETTFDRFLDSCISVCLRSLERTEDTFLLEEVFALINSCLLSDSGALAVRGLRRLEQFVTSDLDTSYLSDDLWATVSHMLQRCLAVRGLPKKPVKPESQELSEERKSEEDAEFAQDIREFVAEDQFLSSRRYIGSNATMVIGLLLSSNLFSIGLRWRLFLIKWLHRGVREWESAAAMLTKYGSNGHSQALAPDYRENEVYGRKWINRLVLQLASTKEIIQIAPDVDQKSNRFAQGQKQVIEMTEAMLLGFVHKEEVAMKAGHSKIDEIMHQRYTTLANELLSGYGNMETKQLNRMSWISPVLLSSCIRSKNEDLRHKVQELVARTSPTANTNKPSAKSAPSKEVDNEMEETIAIPPTSEGNGSKDET